MTRVRLLPLALGLLAAACVENTAPGNDREARLDPPAAPAEMASAAEAIEGVATALLFPQTLTDADLGAVPGAAEHCLFRFTRVGLPVLAYGSSAVLKLNDRLVELPALAEGRYGAAGVDVTVQPLDDDETGGERFAAEFVLRLADAPDELGYHGFAECPAS